MISGCGVAIPTTWEAAARSPSGPAVAIWIFLRSRPSNGGWSFVGQRPTGRPHGRCRSPFPSCAVLPTARCARTFDHSALGWPCRGLAGRVGLAGRAGLAGGAETQAAVYPSTPSSCSARPSAICISSPACRCRRPRHTWRKPWRASTAPTPMQASSQPVIAHPGSGSGAVRSAERSVSSTGALLALAVLTTERKAA